MSIDLSAKLHSPNSLSAHRNDASLWPTGQQERSQKEIVVEDLRNQKIISFSRRNLSYTERYFAELFAEHDLTRNIAYTCDDTFSLVSLVSAGLGVGFAPE